MNTMTEKQLKSTLYKVMQSYVTGDILRMMAQIQRERNKNSYSTIPYLMAIVLEKAAYVLDNVLDWEDRIILGGKGHEI